jgi:flavorubredoxin
MTARIDEIADDIYRISVFVPQVAPPLGFTFSQFLVRDEEPLLFHTLKRKMFPEVSQALAKLIPIETLRWIGFGHFEADECGAMNEWLAASPHAQLVHGMVGCRLSLDDMADRAPRALADGEVIATGKRRFRYIDTPHVPHGWDAAVLYEETEGTLFCGDLFSQYGDPPAVTTSDVVDAATETNNFALSTSLGPTTVPTIRKLAALDPRLLAIMHGSSYAGNGGAALNLLGDRFDAYLKSVM